MRSRPTTIIGEICALAECKNTRDLAKLLKREDICIDSIGAPMTPISLLARQGKIAAANFLISQFGASQDHALLGYAAGGHHTMVKTLLNLVDRQATQVKAAQMAAVNVLLDHESTAKGVSLKYLFGAHFVSKQDVALKGYAIGGYIAEVDALIAQGADKRAAVEGYAIGGHIAEMKIFTDQGFYLDFAVRACALGGHEAAVDDLIAESAIPNIS